MFKRPESVLVVIYTREGEVLLLQRHDNPAFWQSVTGSLEIGEPPAEAARRELFEETGLEAEPVDHRHTERFAIRGAWRSRYAPDVTHNLEHRFSVCLPARRRITLDPTEHDAHVWLPVLPAAERVGSSTNAEAIRQLVAPVAAMTDVEAGTEAGERRDRAH